MSKERDRPTAQDGHLPADEMAHPSSREVLDGEPRQVAQVNMLPDEPLDDVHEESLDAGVPPVLGADTPAAPAQPTSGGWSPTAWLLGLLSLAIGIGALLFVMQGVFQSMPR